MANSAKVQGGITGGAGLALGGASGALTGIGVAAAAGALMGSVVPVLGTVIGAAVGALIGAIPAAISLSNTFAGGTSHAQRMNKWNEALQAAVNSADLQALPALLQAAVQQANQYQALVQVAGPQPPMTISSLLAQAASAEDALEKAGDALSADVTAYQAGHASINPWQYTPAQAALAAMPIDAKSLSAAVAKSTSTNQALASALSSVQPATPLAITATSMANSVPGGA